MLGWEIIDWLTIDADFCVWTRGSLFLILFCLFASILHLHHPGSSATCLLRTRHKTDPLTDDAVSYYFIPVPVRQGPGTRWCHASRSRAILRTSPCTLHASKVHFAVAVAATKNQKACDGAENVSIDKTGDSAASQPPLFLWFLCGLRLCLLLINYNEAV